MDEKFRTTLYDKETGEEVCDTIVANAVKISHINLKAYRIDFSKIKTVDDIVKLMKCIMGTNFTVYNTLEGFDEIKPYLIEIK